MSFMSTPIFHQGKSIGAIYLAEKEKGREFSQEDEEILVTFASQSALAIVNARRYLRERQARAFLQAFINTSPVAVIVFDAKTGKVLYFNRESLRLVEGLRMPGQSPEQLLKVLSFRRTDGMDISLEVTPPATGTGRCRKK